MRNHSTENEFDLHENGRAGEPRMNGFARRLGNWKMAYWLML